MTPKQILDSFSETLMQDERILSPRERELVLNLLHHANTAVQHNSETHEAVRAVIASAVGETVAQRAFAVLGSSIVERILASTAAAQGERDHGESSYEYHLAKKTPAAPGPQPPSQPLRTPAAPGPQPPSMQPLRTPAAPGPQPPSKPLRNPPAPGPQPPSAQPLRTPAVNPPSPGPQPPSAHVGTKVATASATAVAERPQVLPGRCVILDEFLSPQELETLMRFTMEHESDFQASEVINPTAAGGVVNYDHRRSRVLTDLAVQEELILARIRTVLPEVLSKLDMEPFEIAGVESQITSSNDGDYFHYHSDNGSDQVVSRHLTFVYFFHREPKQFEGGELRIHDAQLENDSYVPSGSYQTIVPQQNQIVFFPCELLHEITPVRCGSRQFADSRFTLNGWLRR